MVGEKKMAEGTFPFVKKNLGYDVQQVEKFLASLKMSYENRAVPEEALGSVDIRHASFDLVKKGYDPRFVDAALDRFEELFYAREKNAFFNTKSETEWKDYVTSLFEDILGRLNRPSLKRFKTVTIFAHGYKKSQVDAALEQLKRGLTSKADIKTSQVRKLRFQAERNGYDEAQVDFFLDAVVEYLLAVKKK